MSWRMRWNELANTRETVSHSALFEPRLSILIAEDRRDCYWLYVVTNCLPAAPRGVAAQAGAAQPTLQEPIKDPARFPWHEVTEVAHYWLQVNAMTKPMMVREDSPPYGEKK